MEIKVPWWVKVSGNADKTPPKYPKKEKHIITRHWSPSEWAKATKEEKRGD